MDGALPWQESSTAKQLVPVARAQSLVELLGMRPICFALGYGLNDREFGLANLAGLKGKCLHN